MNEKRYELRCCSADGNLVNVIQKGDKIYTSKEIVDILNQLENDNRKLKKELNNFRPLYFKSEDGCVTLYEKVIE